MSFKKLYLLVYLVSGCLIWGCSQQKSHSKSAAELSFAVSRNPFSVKLMQAGKTVGNIMGENASGLYYVTSQDTEYITHPDSISVNNPDHFKASYQTTDGRKANVDIQRKKDGSLSLQFTVSPAKGILRKGMSFMAYDGESYYGLMERPVDGPQQKSWTPGIKEGLNLRGQKLTMFTKPTPSIYNPFYVSSKGYGVYVHGSWPGRYDMAASDSSRVRFSFEGPALNVTLIPGPEPVNVVKHYNAMVGPPILPPKWAFSVFHWRDEHDQRDTLYDGTKNTSPYNSEVTEDILMLKALDIPNGVYWLDRPWAKGPAGYSDFKWDPDRFPHAKQMVSWIHSKNQKLLLWIAPWVMGKNMIREGRKKGYLIPNQSNKDLKHVRQLVDFTNPKAVSWWGTYMKRVIDDGVDGYKMDRSEEIVPDSTKIVFNNGETARQVHNKYPEMYLKAAYDVMKKYRPNGNFLLMPRAAYTHSRKYGVFWGGDIPSGQWGLRTALIAVQRAAFMGFPYWGSDTGGYWGKKKNFTHENLSRWLAFSCFTPIMEVGPLRNRAVWDMPYHPSYDTTLIATYRLYAKIHTHIKKYAYKMAKNAHKTGEPIIHPLAMAYPNDKKADERWDEYLYGHDILVGIIWKNGQRKFKMYLPKGSWKDAWTGKKYRGPKTLTIDCPLPKIPIFTRGKSKINMGNLHKIYQKSLKIARHKPNLKKLLKKENFKAKPE